MRAIDREARKSKRRREIYAKAAAKHAMLQASARAANQYEDLVSLLCEGHKTTFKRSAFAMLATEKWPEDPVFDDVKERAARQAFETYVPGWFARTFRLANGKRKRLEAAIEKAKLNDKDDHAERIEATARRRDDIQAAKALVNLQPEAVAKAVSKHVDMSEIAVETLSVSVVDGRIVALLDALEIDDMPDEAVTLLQSGKASTKAIPAGKRQELHRDNICSSALRAAIDLLQVLPVDALEVISQTDILDAGTGHITAEPVLYMRVTAQALASVNPKQTEPVALAERLGATFNWTRKSGFRAIDLTAFGFDPEALAQADEVE